MVRSFALAALVATSLLSPEAQAMGGRKRTAPEFQVKIVTLDNRPAVGVVAEQLLVAQGEDPHLEVETLIQSAVTDQRGVAKLSRKAFKVEKAGYPWIRDGKVRVVGSAFLSGCEFDKTSPEAFERAVEFMTTYAPRLVNARGYMTRQACWIESGNIDKHGDLLEKFPRSMMCVIPLPSVEFEVARSRILENCRQFGK